MNLKSVLPRLALVMTLGLLLPVVAPAAIIIDGTFLINDLGDTVIINDTTPGGPTGRLFTSCSVEGCFFNITSSQQMLPTSFFGGLNMLEPVSLLVSDTLEQTDTGGFSTIWQFNSDTVTETPLTGLNGSPATIVEDGTPQLAATLVYGTSGHGDEIFVQSDSEVPEPSSGGLALLGFAALGVVMLRWRIASRAV